jgi:hypothetical protein
VASGHRSTSPSLSAPSQAVIQQRFYRSRTPWHRFDPRQSRRGWPTPRLGRPPSAMAVACNQPHPYLMKTAWQWDPHRLRITGRLSLSLSLFAWTKRFHPVFLKEGILAHRHRSQATQPAGGPYPRREAGPIQTSDSMAHRQRVPQPRKSYQWPPAIRHWGKDPECDRRRRRRPIATSRRCRLHRLFPTGKKRSPSDASMSSYTADRASYPI